MVPVFFCTWKICATGTGAGVTETFFRDSRLINFFKCRRSNVTKTFGILMSFFSHSSVSLSIFWVIFSGPPQKKFIVGTCHAHTHAESSTCSDSASVKVFLQVQLAIASSTCKKNGRFLFHFVIGSFYGRVLPKYISPHRCTFNGNRQSQSTSEWKYH